jgi:hypothetical protein
MDFLILFVVFSFGIGYLFLAYKIVTPFLHSINKPLNASTRFMMLLILIGFGSILHEFSLGGRQVMLFYFEKSFFISGISVYIVLIIISFISSMVLFRISNGIINIISKENVKAELIKNNTLIAGKFGILYLMLTFLLRTPLLKLSLSLIN